MMNEPNQLSSYQWNDQSKIWIENFSPKKKPTECYIKNKQEVVCKR